MRVRQNSHLLALVGVIGLIACDGDKTPEQEDAECAVPIAEAGDDSTVVLGSAADLDGTFSEICEAYLESGELSYAWTFETVPADSSVDESALSDNRSTTASAPTFTPDTDGYYVLSLVVTDNDDQESLPDLVVVTVSVGDAPPVADCGGNHEGMTDEAVSLDGSDSYDPEGAELEYSWSLSQAPSCSDLTSSDIYNGAGPTPTVVPDCDGIYVIGLVVSDGEQWSDYAYCSVDVASTNRTPVADAGDAEELGACADNPLYLNGFGSYDLDGDTLSYEWTLVSVPADSAATADDFGDTDTAEPYFSWDVSGEYTFQLQVYDGETWSAPDIVTLIIDDEEENGSPVANAGDDQSVSTEADCTSSSYVWTCEDCTEVTVELDGSASTDEDGDLPVYTWSESTGTLAFNNSHAALTDATIAAQPAEYGVDNTLELVVELEVADCLESDTDSVTITYTCTGEAAE